MLKINAFICVAYISNY